MKSHSYMFSMFLYAYPAKSGTNRGKKVYSIFRLPDFPDFRTIYLYLLINIIYL